MSYEVRKKPQAERDIEECFVYIGEDNLDIAVHFLVAVEDSIEQVGRNRFIGKTCEFKDSKIKNLRMWKVKDFTNYEDLSECDYFGEEYAKILKSVGWIETEKDFQVGAIPKDVYFKLCELQKNPWMFAMFCGFHECDLCQFQGETEISNIFIPHNNKIYICPELITHYINAHSYTQQCINLGFSLGELCALGVILSHTKFAKNAERRTSIISLLKPCLVYLPPGEFVEAV